MMNVNRFGFGVSAFAVAAVGLTLAGCAASSPSLTGVPKRVVVEKIPDEAPIQPITVTQKILPEQTPKVDILFVIDHSQSMGPHQAALAKNINSFANAFSASENVDFHIGMVTIGDRHRIHPGTLNYWPDGLLHPLKDPQTGQVLPGNRFVTPMPNFGRVLAASLLVGELKLTDGGPEEEEILSPIASSMDTQLNPGFWRPEAHMAVIMLTDADDSSLIGEEDLYHRMLDFKNGDESKISTYGVFAFTDPETKQSCFPDWGLVNKKTGAFSLPTKLLNFVRISNGLDYDKSSNPNVFSICSADYGRHLAQVGTAIDQKAVPHIRVALPAQAQAGTLIVMVNGKLVPPAGHWSIDPSTAVINFSDLRGFVRPDGSGDISVTFTPVDNSLINRPGRTRTAN